MGTSCAAARNKEEGDSALWGRSVGTRSVTATVLPLVAYKASLVRRCGPAVPLGAEAEEAVQSGRFLPLGPIRPNSSAPRATFEFERVHAGPGGSSLHRQRRAPRAQDEGRVLGPLWPTSLAIAPAALAARAAGTMPGGYCRNSGTWGSPDDAKVEPTPLGSTRRPARHEAKAGDGPPHLRVKTCTARQNPGRGVGCLRVQPLSGTLLKTRRPLGSVVLQAAGLLLEASFVLKRIRDRKSTRLNSSHSGESRMPSSA